MAGRPGLDGGRDRSCSRTDTIGVVRHEAIVGCGKSIPPAVASEGLRRSMEVAMSERPATRPTKTAGVAKSEYIQMTTDKSA